MILYSIDDRSSDRLLPLGLDSNNILRVKTLSMYAPYGKFTYYEYRDATSGKFVLVRNELGRFYFQPSMAVLGRVNLENASGHIYDVQQNVRVFASYHFSPHYSVLPTVTKNGSGTITTSHCLYDQDYFNPHPLTDSTYPALHNTTLIGNLVTVTIQQLNGIPRLDLADGNAYRGRNLRLGTFGWFLIQAHGNISFGQYPLVWNVRSGSPTSDQQYNQEAYTNDMLRSGSDAYYLIKTDFGKTGLGGQGTYFQSVRSIDQPALRVNLSNNSWIKFVSWGFDAWPAYTEYIPN